MSWNDLKPHSSGQLSDGIAAGGNGPKDIEQVLSVGTEAFAIALKRSQHVFGFLTHHTPKDWPAITEVGLVAMINLGVFLQHVQRFGSLRLTQGLPNAIRSLALFSLAASTVTMTDFPRMSLRELSRIAAG